MSSFSRFQDLNQKRGIANQKTNSSFILKGYPSISIYNKDGIEKNACVVNRQEKDMAYIYTHVNDKLSIGSTWSAKGLHWLISEEIVTIKDVQWNKYIAFLCNMEIDGNWGYFIGPEKTYINVALKQDMILQSQAKPMLILPTGIVNIGDKIKIKNRVWLIQEEDSISTEGLTYCSLRADTISKELNDGSSTIIEKNPNRTPIVKPSTPDEMVFRPNEEITLSTEEGYFKCNNDAVQVKKLTKTEVVILIPFGVGDVQVKIKKEQQIVIYTLKQEM